MNKQNLLLPVLLMIVLLINIIFCLLNIIPANDTCSRYAPMADPEKQIGKHDQYCMTDDFFPGENL